MNKSYVEKTTQGYNLMNLSLVEVEIIYSALMEIESCWPCRCVESDIINTINQKIKSEIPEIKKSINLKQKPPNQSTQSKDTNHIKPLQFNTQRKIK